MTAAEGGDQARHAWGAWDRISLRTRLVVLIVALIGTGLGVAAIATTTLVQRYLVDQVDEQLRSDGVSWVATFLNDSQTGTTSQSLPSDYFGQLTTTQGVTVSAPLEYERTRRQYGTPQIPGWTLDEVVARGGQPITVHATLASGERSATEWRLIAGTTTADGTTHIVYIGLPLKRVQAATHQMGKVLGFSALTIITFGGLAAYVAVRRELRPLREIESTAAAIAAGDLTRRVPPAPPSTEVGSLTASLNGMLTQIESSFAAQEESEGRMRRFVSDASHELRTPLATIRGYGELYRMGALTTPDQVEDTMRRIEDSATRMGTLVNDLLSLARLDEGRPVRKEPVDLTSLAADSARDLGALDPSRAVGLLPLHPPGPGDADGGVPRVVVVGDEDQLRQVLANLVGNVARHTPAGSPAQLALGFADAARERVVLEVRDHGPGVSDEQAEHVFERFYRADSSRNRASGGSGLGLAIVRSIVAAHDGDVTVHATPGGGMTVRLELPAAGPSGTPAPPGPGQPDRHGEAAVTGAVNGAADGSGDRAGVRTE